MTLSLENSLNAVLKSTENSIISFQVPIAKTSSPPEYTSTIFLPSVFSFVLSVIILQYSLNNSFFSSIKFFLSNIKFITLLKKSDKYLDKTTVFENLTNLYGSFSPSILTNPLSSKPV